MKELDISRVEFSVFDRKRNIVIPKYLTTDLAEDIGIQAGDGSIGLYKYKHKNQTDYYIKCSGHPKDDYNWYRGFILPLKNKLFNLDLPLRFFSDNSISIQIRSKAILTFYRNAIGLPVGKKDCIRVPEIIFNSKSESIKKGFLRGVFDCDFSVTFKRKYKKLHTYPVITTSLASKNLRNQIIIMLREFGFINISTLDQKVFDKRTNNVHNKYSLFISGDKMLNKWFREIGSHNIKNIAKFSIWAKHGFYPPRLTHIERIKILTEEINPVIFYGACKI